MNDLKLDPLTHDLLIEDGNFKLLNSEAEVARQTLEINLLFYRGEWFLDLDYGIPYLQQITKRGASKELVDTIIKSAILNSYRIDSIKTYRSEISKGVYTVLEFQGLTTDGDIISITNQNII